MGSGTLLTSDISIKRCKKYKEFIEFYDKELTSLGVFQIPHHGAKGTWNDKILSQYPTAMFLASYGIGNQYKHPHAKVIDSLRNNGKTFFLGNDFCKIEYIIKSYFQRTVYSLSRGRGLYRVKSS